MNAQAFFLLVSNMRSQQRDYFRTKNPQALSESKRLERLVDAEINRVQELMNNRVLPKQGELFDKNA
jgi:hypothetical protein